MQTLHEGNLRRSPIFGSLLLAALILQLAGLLLPFMEFDAALRRARRATLLESVELLWDGKLYVIAILVAFFSVAFPFAKILGIAYAWYGQMPGRSRTRSIGQLSALGKWSMLDPLAVALLVTVAQDQWAVSARTESGVICFLMAVTISMFLSEIAGAADERSVRRPSAFARSHTRRPAWTVPAALTVALAAYALALWTPFLQVDQFLLRRSSLGIVGACFSLFSSGQWALGALMMVGLILMPALLLGAELGAWLARREPWACARWIARCDTMAKWTMLEVFSLALVLFLLEGDEFIATKAKPGLWLLLGAIAAQIAARWWNRRVLSGVR